MRKIVFKNFFPENNTFFGSSLLVSFLLYSPVFLFVINIIFYLLFSLEYLNSLFYFIWIFNCIFAILFIFIFVFFIKIDLWFRGGIFFLSAYFIFLIWVFLFSQWLLQTWHDQGGYLGYAGRISNNQTLKIFDDSVVSLYQYVYRDWQIDLAFPNVKFWPFFLSTFYHIFLFKWFSLAIALLHSIWFFYLVLIARNFFNVSKNTISIFLWCYILSYYCNYYTRSGFIENILFAQIWSIVYFFLSYLKNDHKKELFFSFLFTLSIFFTRPESIIYLASFFLALALYFFNKKNLSIKFALVFVTIGIWISFAVDIFLFKWFLSEGIKNISSYWTYNYAYEGKFSVLGVIVTYTLTMQLMSLCLFGFLSAKKIFSNKYLIYVFILILPQIMFFLFPNIQLVMPWAYRRFWPGIFVFWLFLFFIFWARGIFKDKLSRILIASLLIFSGGKIYWLFAHENVLSQVTDMGHFFETNNTPDTAMFAIDNSWAYASILSDFFGHSLIIDRPPFKKIEILNYYLDNKKHIYVITYISSPSKVIELYRKELGITIDANDIRLEKVYPIRYWSITSYFDGNSLFSNRRDFLWYNHLISEWQILSESAVTTKISNIYIYKISNNWYFPIYPNTQYWDEKDIYKANDLSIFKTEDLRI